MKKSLLTLEIILGVLAMTMFSLKAEDDLADLKECSPRGGLPNFFAKLKADKEVKIAYFGGSITAQNGWRVLSLKWFQEKFPKAKISEINAAIGGTGSSLGVFRAEHDVLRLKPDMIFIEFAVNDGSNSKENIRKAFEGIIRQTWKALPDCDICFVYTVVAGDKKNLFANKMKRSATAMEEIADYYDIPTIHLGVEVAKLAKEDKLVFKAQKDKMTRVSGDELNKNSGALVNEDGKIPFSPDGVHPYTDTGHKLYMTAIARSMPIIEQVGKAGPHEIKKAMGDNFEEAKMLPVSKGEMSREGWTKIEKGNSLYSFNNRLPEIWKATPGATLKFKFKGTKAAMYDLLGPGCGNLEVTVDGKTKKSKRIDPYCTYYRLGTLDVGSEMKDEIHSVEIKVLDEKLDKNKILFENNRADLAKNPAKYAPTDWYVGAIFIIGELVD